MKQRRERETLRLEAVLLNLIVSVIVLAVLPDTSFAQSVLSKAIRTSKSMEPALSHPEQGRAAQQKLDALRAWLRSRNWPREQRHFSLNTLS
jgi:type II secretory pathway predicted ATPase ExeA